MRKIEENMRFAVRHCLDWRQGNTAVFYISAQESGNPFGARSEIFLHGNHIADYWHETGEVEVNRQTLCKWPTRTTKSRLWALGANVTTAKGKTLLNGGLVS